MDLNAALVRWLLLNVRVVEALDRGPGPVRKVLLVGVEIRSVEGMQVLELSLLLLAPVNPFQLLLHWVCELISKYNLSSYSNAG